MSFDALAWAAKQTTGSSSTKLVLLGLAECASRPEAFAFPSIAALVEFTSLDRKTIVKALDKLEADGFSKDTGKRMGRTGQIKVYQLLLPSQEIQGNTEQYQKRHPSKEAQFSHERVPKTVHGISKGTSNTSGAKAPSVSRALPFPGEGYSTDDKKMTQEHALRVLCVTWAVTELQWTTQDAGAEFLRFKDSALAADRRYKDWLAAWRNWCRSPFQKTKPADDHDNFKWGKMPKLDHARAVAPKPTVLVPVRD